MTENNEHLALWVVALRLVRRRNWPDCPSPRSSTGAWPTTTSPVPRPRRALGRAGLLTADELQRMEDALDTLQRHVDDGSFAPSKTMRTKAPPSNAV